MTERLTDDQCWAIALAKDRRYDGQFLTGVHSTGIYCRPSCPARAPKRENVRFYASAAEAEAAGLRACKRCAPNQQSNEEAAVLAAIDEIRSAEDGAPTLDALAQLTGYSPAHFQRLFKRSTGLSPAAYARALREERARDALTGEGSVTDAIYAAGYGAPSRFYAASKEKMGMAPSAWANGGKGVTIHWVVVPTSLGDMLVAATDKGVCRLSFDEDERELARRFPNAELVEGGETFRAACSPKSIASVEQPGDFAHIPLDVKGTAFQEACWKALREIPPRARRAPMPRSRRRRATPEPSAPPAALTPATMSRS